MRRECVGVFVCEISKRVRVNLKLIRAAKTRHFPYRTETSPGAFPLWQASGPTVTGELVCEIASPSKLCIYLWWIGANNMHFIIEERKVNSCVHERGSESFTYSVLLKSKRYFTTTDLNSISVPKLIGPADPPVMSFSASSILTFRSSP